MDETETKNSNDPIIFREELDINLNDLFTIDFKNLKIFLTTILKNQNEMSQKMNMMENNINEKENKNNKNFTILNKKIPLRSRSNHKTIAQRGSLPYCRLTCRLSNYKSTINYTRNFRHWIVRILLVVIMPSTPLKFFI